HAECARQISPSTHQTSRPILQLEEGHRHPERRGQDCADVVGKKTVSQSAKECFLRAFLLAQAHAQQTAMHTGSGKGWDVIYPFETSHSPASAASNFGIPVKAGFSQSRNHPRIIEK